MLKDGCWPRAVVQRILFLLTSTSILRIIRLAWLTVFKSPFIHVLFPYFHCFIQAFAFTFIRSEIDWLSPLFLSFIIRHFCLGTVKQNLMHFGPLFKGKELAGIPSFIIILESLKTKTASSRLRERSWKMDVVLKAKFGHK